MKRCDDEHCEDGWVTYPPLQDGGMCAVRPCEQCARLYRLEELAERLKNDFSSAGRQHGQ